jgi:hypothetical protein
MGEQQEMSIKEEQEREGGQEVRKEAGREGGIEAGQEVEKEAVKENVKKAGKEDEKEAGQEDEKEAGQGVEKEAGHAVEKKAGQEDEKGAGQGVDKEDGQGIDKETGQGLEKEAGDQCSSTTEALSAPPPLGLNSSQILQNSNTKMAAFQQEPDGSKHPNASTDQDEKPDQSEHSPSSNGLKESRFRLSTLEMSTPGESIAGKDDQDTRENGSMTLHTDEAVATKKKADKRRLPIEDFDDMLQHVGSWGRFVNRLLPKLLLKGTVQRDGSGRN